MNPMETLRDEHQLILKMLQVIEQCAPRFKAADLTEVKTMEMAVDFFKNFTDRCHHGKEEEILFPVLVEKGFGLEGGPIGAMLEDHKRGREAVQGFRIALAAINAGDTGAAPTLGDNILVYVTLLRKHIKKEDYGLFVTAEKRLTAAELANLSERFEKLAKNEVGEEIHAHYTKIVGQLLDKYSLA